MNTTRERVSAIVASTLEIGDDTTVDSVRMGEHPNWDSMGHIQLIMAIEEEFHCRFQPFEIPRLSSVDAITDSVTRHESRQSSR